MYGYIRYIIVIILSYFLTGASLRYIQAARRVPDRQGPLRGLPGGCPGAPLPGRGLRLRAAVGEERTDGRPRGERLLVGHARRTSKRGACFREECVVFLEEVQGWLVG